MSGSGKSTLLALLALLEKPTEGMVLFQGKDITGFNDAEKEDYRNFECGFVFQHFQLFDDLSAEENVALPLQLRGEEEKTVIRNVDHLFSAFHMEAIQKRKVRLLSGGEKQRIALLRALIGGPSIIFADEPTGALDEKNAALVMNFLKEIAQKRSVILVSHNPALVSQYADRVLTLEEGRLVSNVETVEDKATVDSQRATIRKRGRNKKWVFRFFWKHLHEDHLKNVLSYLSGLVAYLALLLFLGFASGSHGVLESQKRQSLQYLQATLSEKTIYPIEGSPLSLTQQARPTWEEAQTVVESLPGVSLHADYSYFFPTYSAFSINAQQSDPVSFCPIEDITLSNRQSVFSIEGTLPDDQSFSSVVVNSQFADAFSEPVLKKTIRLSKETIVFHEDKETKITLDFSFEIAAIVKEFSFLNQPRVYYSYPALESYFSSYRPIRSEKATIASLVDEATGDSAVSSYGYLLFADSEKTAERLKGAAEKLEKEGSVFSIASASYLTETTFSSLIDAFAQSLLPFLIIGVVSVFFIMGSLAFSSFMRRKKEAALLWALGARKNDVTSLFLSESVFLSLLSAFGALSIAYPAQRLLAAFLYAKTKVAGLIEIPWRTFLGIPLFPIIGILLFSILTPLIGAGLPLWRAKRTNLVEELRDE